MLGSTTAIRVPKGINLGVDKLWPTSASVNERWGEGEWNFHFEWFPFLLLLSQTIYWYCLFTHWSWNMRGINVECWRLMKKLKEVAHLLPTDQRPISHDDRWWFGPFRFVFLFEFAFPLNSIQLNPNPVKNLNRFSRRHPVPFGHHDCQALTHTHTHTHARARARLHTIRCRIGFDDFRRWLIWSFKIIMQNGWFPTATYCIYFQN